jgi:zinc protease
VKTQRYAWLPTLCALATAAAWLPLQAAETPPAPGPARPLVLPQPTKLKLDNGLQATLVEYGDLPKVTVELVVRAGELNGGEKTGLANFTGRLMQEGTEQHSAKEIADMTAALGGGISVAAGNDTTTISGDVLAENAPALIALIAEVARMPALPDSEVERIRNDLLRGLSVARTQAQSLAREAFLKTLYGPDHPYGRLFPTEEQLKSYTVADIRAFHASNFGARRSHLYVAGKFDEMAVQKAVRSAFGDWAAGPDVLVDVPKVMAKHTVVLIDRPGAPQSTVILGLRAPEPSSPDFLPLQIMNSLLGGSFASRITANIRENKGYTYSPNSGLLSNYKTAAWAEFADVTSAHTADSLVEIFREIARLQAETPSADELTGVKNYSTGTFVLRNSDRGSIIGGLRDIDLQGLPDDYLSTYVEHVEAVTPEEVSRLAGEYLKTDDMTLVVVGDLKTVKPQLQKLQWLKPGDLD